MPDRNCSNCRWADPTVDEDEGPIIWCRRWPPQITSVSDSEVSDAFTVSWPPVRDHDWCGEFEATEQTEHDDPIERTA